MAMEMNCCSKDMAAMKEMPKPAAPMAMAQDPMIDEMMADMKASESKIGALVATMNNAPQGGKLDAAIAVINALAADCKAMHAKMEQKMTAMHPAAPMAMPKPDGKPQH